MLGDATTGIGDGMKQYVVWLRHRFEVTLRMVTVEATSFYEASCAARARHSDCVVARVYVKDSYEDD